MASVFLACTASAEDHPYARSDFNRMSAYAAADEVKTHTIANNAENADLVVFVGSARPNFSDISNSALYKQHKNKSLIIYSGDLSIPLLPGLYSCLENDWSIRHRKSIGAGYYLRVTDNTSLDIDASIDECKYLYSFLGNAGNHPVRKEICASVSNRGYVKDSSLDSIQQDDGVSGDNKQRGLRYKELLAESKFVLCPRGIGVSSWRLFETMRAGRVPVIISDDWVAPIGPKWSEFAVFVKEADVAKIPEILKIKESQAMQLGALARREWQDHYAQEVVFTKTVDLLLAIQANAAKENSLITALTYTQYLQPHYIRHWILSPIKQQLRAFFNSK